MKNIFYIILLFGISTSLMAQITKDALGLRLGGDGDIIEVELNYQLKISDVNRIEFGLGTFNEGMVSTGLYIVGMYQWAWTIKGGLNWYIGPGAGVSIFVENKIIPIIHPNLGVGAQMGIEYNFSQKSYPVIVSLDTRPMWNVFGEYSGMNVNVGAGVRFIIPQILQ